MEEVECEGYLGDPSVQGSLRILPWEGVWLRLTRNLDKPRGFVNGAIDVFPYDSLPDLCRDNATLAKKTSQDLFLDNRYTLPSENLEYITAIS